MMEGESNPSYSSPVCFPVAKLRSDLGQICRIMLKHLDPLLDLFQEPVDLLHGDREFKLLPMRYLLALSATPRLYSGTRNARSFIPCRLRHIGLPCKVLV